MPHFATASNASLRKLRRGAVAVGIAGTMAIGISGCGSDVYSSNGPASRQLDSISAQLRRQTGQGELEAYLKLAAQKSNESPMKLGDIEKAAAAAYHDTYGTRICAAKFISQGVMFSPPTRYDYMICRQSDAMFSINDAMFGYPNKEFYIGTYISKKLDCELPHSALATLKGYNRYNIFTYLDEHMEVVLAIAAMALFVSMAVFEEIQAGARNMKKAVKFLARNAKRAAKFTATKAKGLAQRIRGDDAHAARLREPVHRSRAQRIRSAIRRKRGD